MLAARGYRGFTLVEILVVLLLLAIVVGLVTPSMLNLRKSAERQGALSALLHEIGLLPYQAYLGGEAIVFPPAAGLVTLPEGWDVELAPPVRYEVNGLCTSGRLRVTDPERNVTVYEIQPFSCKPEIVDAVNP
ncbi:MAG: prepilin-type N-terminal cleavage/methylation domain-containing protein [Gammaproteobacteria bacterium]|nr:prepilin-type N-terminal cleavage/methylation domain-containing protein [Gammaproteobacteria bacterium]